MTAVNLLQGAEGMSRLVANSFVSGLWQGAVLAACVWLCLRMMPRTTAAVRFAIWTAVFAILAVLPLVHAYSSNSGAVTSGNGAVVHVDVRWSFAIAAAWLIVSLVRGVKLAMSAVRLRGIWKRAVPVEGCHEVLLAAGIRGVEICTSKDVDRPSVIGFFSPRILIPEELFGRLTTAEFGQIVLHEIGHLRRADDWINLLQKLSLVVVPLNPILIWIERRLCLERELACDDDVLRMTKAPKAYATCLTNLAEQRLGRRAAVLSLGAWERRSELARRVHSILRGGQTMGRTQARVVMGAIVLGLVGGSAELARCPEFVSFSRAASTVSAEAQSVPPAGYKAVSFPVSSNMTVGAANETLLKASMPVNRGSLPVNSESRPVSPVKKAMAKRRDHGVSPVLQSRVAFSQARRERRPVQGWIVLTTWHEPVRRGSVGAEERDFYPSYAAVPTPGGWLVIQL
jgi:beta-lactamase regulating signal transducer with metallopeptidase domain